MRIALLLLFNFLAHLSSATDRPGLYKFIYLTVADHNRKLLPFVAGKFQEIIEFYSPSLSLQSENEMSFNITYQLIESLQNHINEANNFLPYIETYEHYKMVPFTKPSSYFLCEPYYKQAEFWMKTNVNLMQQLISTVTMKIPQIFLTKLTHQLQSFLDQNPSMQIPLKNKKSMSLLEQVKIKLIEIEYLKVSQILDQVHSSVNQLVNILEESAANSNFINKAADQLSALQFQIMNIAAIFVQKSELLEKVLMVQLIRKMEQTINTINTYRHKSSGIIKRELLAQEKPSIFQDEIHKVSDHQIKETMRRTLKAIRESLKQLSSEIRIQIVIGAPNALNQ